MHQPVEQHDLPTLLGIVSGSWSMFSNSLREAWERRHELPQREQDELKLLVKAHDEAIRILIATRMYAEQTFTYETPTKGEA